MKRRLPVCICVMTLCLLAVGAYAGDSIPVRPVTDLANIQPEPVDWQPLDRLNSGLNQIQSNTADSSQLWRSAEERQDELQRTRPAILGNVNPIQRSLTPQSSSRSSLKIRRLDNGNGLGFGLGTLDRDGDRDLDALIMGWSGNSWAWNQHSSPNPEGPTTYSGNYYIMPDYGIDFPFKVMNFTFYNNDATTAWDAGVVVNNGAWPDATALSALQAPGYTGNDQTWSTVDLSGSNVFGNISNPIVFTALHWPDTCQYSAPGSGCAVVYDIAAPDLDIDWLRLDFSAVYNYPTADVVDYLMFEAMPDTCDQAVDWPLSIPGTVINHNTNYGSDDYDPNDCGIAKNGPDLVYALTPGANVTVNITCSTIIGGPDLVLLLSDACDPMNCVNQADAAGAAGTETISGQTLTGGTTYYIIVDTSTGGPFNLTVTPTGSAPSNDTCATASTLTVPASISATTYTAANDYSANCGDVLGSDGGDVVYSYTPASDEYIYVSVAPDDFDAATYIVTDCGDLTNCVASADSSGENGEEILSCVFLSSGTTYYLIVDGYDSDDFGSFTLTVNPTSPPANDTCAAAETISSLPASLIGDTSCATDDYDGSCTGATMEGGDVVYSYTTGVDAEHLLFVLGPDGFDGGLYISPDCSDPAIPSCTGWADYFSAGGEEYLCVELAASTTYYIFVDGYTATDNGAFTLDVVSASEPPNDTCATAEAITSLPAAYLGATTCGMNDYDPTAAGCTGSDEIGPDVAFSYTASANGYISALVSSYYGDVDFALYVLDNDCSDPAASCIAGSDAGLTGDFEQVNCVPVVSGHTYYIIVDSYSPAHFGVYYLNVWESTMPTNEDCSSAMAAVLPFSYTGTTGCAASDYNPPAGTCASGGGAGPDVVFTYTPTSDETLVAVMDPYFWRSTFYVMAGDCSDYGNCIAGATSDGDGYPVSTGCFSVTSGTTYYFIVDGWRTTDYGLYDLEIRSTTVPTNNDCASAQVLSLPATINGDTTCATSDFGFDLGGGVYYGVGAPDLVFDLPDYPSGGNINITFAPEFYGAIILIEDCDLPSESFTMLSPSVPPGYVYRENCLALSSGVDYKLLVEGEEDIDYGAFELIVENAVIPTNDTCASATVISTIPYSDTGATDCAANDYDPGSGGCASGWEQEGFDVVYSFTPPANMDLAVTLDTPYHDSSVYIVTDCTDVANTCIAGMDDNGGIGTENLDGVALSAGTTYYIIVDGYSQYQAGTYTITVDEYVPPVVPAVGPLGAGLLVLILTGFLGIRRRR